MKYQVLYSVSAPYSGMMVYTAVVYEVFDSVATRVREKRQQVTYRRSHKTLHPRSESQSSITP